MSLKKLTPLKAGDTVAIVSPSSHFKPEDFLKGVAHLAKAGLTAQYRSDIFSRELYLCGSDHRRFKELADALKDPSVTAIFFARGGYGAMRLLPELYKLKAPSKPKIVAGFSDATVILNFVKTQWRWPVFYAPTLLSFSGNVMDKQSGKIFFQELKGQRPYPHKVKSLKVLKSGKAEGELVGGCLTLVTHGLGTPYALPLSNKILFLEDTGEDPYAIDRMLTHLKLANQLKGLKGMIWGSLSQNKPQSEYIKMLQSVLKDQTFPVLYDFPAGHETRRHTFVMGLKVKMNSQKKLVEFLDSPFKIK